ncbi:hypothetical protein F5X97DRAFT_340840 [Nemania serpens]|nr:hypothetical protein F5X97DRAFT_340840 [Nemania serpens]
MLEKADRYLTYPTSIFAHLRDSTEPPASEKSSQRLEDEVVLVTMAGTYSPMLSLVVVHYHLLTRPNIMAKLRTELGGAHGSTIPTAADLERFPYLSAIAQEARHLTFGLTGRNARVSPDEPMMYKDKERGQTCIQVRNMLKRMMRRPYYRLHVAAVL